MDNPAIPFRAAAPLAGDAAYVNHPMASACCDAARTVDRSDQWRATASGGI